MPPETLQAMLDEHSSYISYMNGIGFSREECMQLRMLWAAQELNRNVKMLDNHLQTGSRTKIIRETAEPAYLIEGLAELMQIASSTGPRQTLSDRIYKWWTRKRLARHDEVT